MTATLAIDTRTTVGQLVAQRPDRSRLFEKLGIDYCCGGKKSLAEVCQAKGLDAGTVAALLAAMPSDPHDQLVDAAVMSLTELADHIEQTHHAYLKQELPRLEQMVQKVAAVHGHVYPWLNQLRDVFLGFQRELVSHMGKEEHVLFPMIRAIEQGQSGVSDHCGGLGNPIRMMEHEHDDAGNDLAQMRELSDGFTPPPGACNTFIAMLDGLHQLEANMHQHVHKENNILFPRAMQAQGPAQAGG